MQWSGFSETRLDSRAGSRVSGISPPAQAACLLLMRLSTRCTGLDSNRDRVRTRE
jgi:hypothetical protein